VSTLSSNAWCQLCSALLLPTRLLHVALELSWQHISMLKAVCFAFAELIIVLAPLLLLLLLLLLPQAMFYARQGGVRHAVPTRCPGQLQLQPVPGEAA
jgi:hypothetical protein